MMPIKDRYDIAQRLKEFRRLRRLTQVQVADAVGVGRPAYGSYEEGRAEPPIPVMFRLVKFYNLQSIDHLLGEVNCEMNETHPVLQSYFQLKPELRQVVDFILNQNKNGTGDPEH